jgi:hypothetical protein
MVAFREGSCLTATMGGSMEGGGVLGLWVYEYLFLRCSSLETAFYGGWLLSTCEDSNFFFKKGVLGSSHVFCMRGI